MLALDDILIMLTPYIGFIAHVIIISLFIVLVVLLLAGRLLVVVLHPSRYSVLSILRLRLWLLLLLVLLLNYFWSYLLFLLLFSMFIVCITYLLLFRVVLSVIIVSHASHILILHLLAPILVNSTSNPEFLTLQFLCESLIYLHFANIGGWCLEFGIVFSCCESLIFLFLIVVYTAIWLCLTHWLSLIIWNIFD